MPRQTSVSKLPYRQLLPAIRQRQRATDRQEALDRLGQARPQRWILDALAEVVRSSP